MALPVIVLLACTSLSCAHTRLPSRGRALTGTCGGACEYYQGCKGEHGPAEHRACVSDCRVIFSEDGEMDRRALRELEKLECPAIVSYIEGDSGRGPGEVSEREGRKREETSSLP